MMFNIYSLFGVPVKWMGKTNFLKSLGFFVVFFFAIFCLLENKYFFKASHGGKISETINMNFTFSFLLYFFSQARLLCPCMALIGFFFFVVFFQLFSFLLRFFCLYFYEKIEEKVEKRTKISVATQTLAFCLNSLVNR